MLLSYQHTIKETVSAFGVGLHNGHKTTIRLKPAKEGSGIIFKRIDIADDNKNEIKAIYSNVNNTKLCTSLCNEYGVQVSTVEHLMAALWACGIDNIIIEIDNQEVPIMDGSSEPFLFLIECAGKKELSSPRKIIEITKEIYVEENDSFIKASPGSGFEIKMDIDFPNKFIGKQSAKFDLKMLSFKMDISRARTFGSIDDVNYLRSIGLAKGASLENAIAISQEGVLNQSGLRYANEFARHKILDSIGDFYLSGGFIIGHFHCSKSGHFLNNKLLHKIFENENSWKFSDLTNNNFMIDLVENYSFNNI